MFKMFFMIVFFFVFPGLSQGAPIGDQTAGPAAKINFSEADELDIPTGVLADITTIPITGALYHITDAISTTDCIAGNGSTSSLCIYNGTSWVAADAPTNLTIQQQPASVVVSSSTGDDITIIAADSSNAGVMTAADKIKSDGVEGGATADQAASEVPFTPTDSVLATDLQAGLAEVGTSAAGLWGLSGVAQGSSDYGAFTGATIPDNQKTKQALQSLEIAVEVRNTNPTALNVFTSDDCTLVSGMIEGDLCFEY